MSVTPPPSMSRVTSLNSLIEKEEIPPSKNKYIREFVHIKQILENMDTDNFFIHRIYRDIKTYIEINCDHCYVDDYVDLDPDNGGKIIKYCEYCYKTL